MKIILQEKKGYTWTKTDSSYFRGYIQDEMGIVRCKEEAISYLEKNITLHQLSNTLAKSYGSFAFVTQKYDKVYAATDIARSMPLYFSKDLSVISDSSEIVREVLGIEKEKIDYRRAAELLDSTYVVHDNTMYSEIRQIELGTAIEISGRTYNKFQYFKHFKVIEDISKDDAIQKLKQTTEKALSRILKVVNGRQIVLSLSGGYDSRYIACSLKSMGMDNIVCYTYGRGDSFETIQSEKVAKALGFKWYCYEYYDDEIKNLISKENQEYFEYCNGHDYTIYLQNYIAVKKLTQEGKIDDNAVFLTGLCNDMPTGFYIPTHDEVESFGCTIDGCASYIIHDRFVRFRLNESSRHEYEQEVAEKIKECGLKVVDFDSFCQAFTCIYTSYNHSRCFLNMNKVHEFFGHEWLLPCWDKELLEFWYAMPTEFRFKQGLYEEYICKYLASPYGVGTKKHINHLGKTPFSRYLKRKIGGILVRLSYPLGIPIKRKTDINNFAPLEVLLYKNIVQKKAVKPERAALMLLITVYLMEKRYGTNWYTKVRKDFFE